MPYIDKFSRDKLHNANLVELCNKIETCGELNYIITIICLEYLNKHGISYQSFNDISGVLFNAGLEMYRRKTSEYEDTKIQSNGDVY